MHTQTINLVVTRHRPLVDLLRERGIITAATPVLEHASISDVRGRHVLGVLPHHLSSQCASISEIPMSLTTADREAMQRGDLSLERTREVAGDPVTYVVRRDGRELVRAAEAKHLRGWSKLDFEGSVYWRLAALLSGRSTVAGRRITDPRQLVIAVALHFAGQTTESGPHLCDDGVLRYGWDDSAPEITTGIVRWSGDGDHAGAEVDLDTMRIRVYASGPEWTDWLDLSPLLPV